jgi:hypothetical protein
VIRLVRLDVAWPGADATIACVRNWQLCCTAAIALPAILVACSFSRTPPQPLRMSQPATISSTGPPPLTTAIALPFEPMSLTFSASVNKLYASGCSFHPVDLRSRNGVRVDGERIKTSGLLADGSVIGIGGYEFVFEIGPEEAS